MSHQSPLVSRMFQLSGTHCSPAPASPLQVLSALGAGLGLGPVLGVGVGEIRHFSASDVVPHELFTNNSVMALPSTAEDEHT